jgi:hypothetical protein
MIDRVAVVVEAVVVVAKERVAHMKEQSMGKLHLRLSGQ